jgi:fluoroquinolone transport system ATP-binding protein
MSPVITVDGLTFSYPKTAEPAVRDLSFTVEEGEIFGFLGPSGAGKSTTQKILIGLLGGHGGSVDVWGKEPTTWRSEYYRRIGVSFELPNHYLKLTGLENLEFFGSLYPGESPGEKEDPMRLLERVGLAGAANVRVGKYSKGMQMRLVFIRALLHRPRLLFLDEPTSGMDPANGRIIKDMIRELRDQGRTVFLTTHDMATADQLCDRVAFVVDGQIAALDSPAEHKLTRSQRVVRVTHRSTSGDDLRYEDFPMDELADDEQFQKLVRSGRVEAMHSQEASLEDVFIDITGRTLR